LAVFFEGRKGKLFQTSFFTKGGRIGGFKGEGGGRRSYFSLTEGEGGKKERLFIFVFLHTERRKRTTF